MRYRLRTLQILIAIVGVGLAWWRDRSQLSSRLELREQQIRVLQGNLQSERDRGIPVAMRSPFTSVEETIEFFKSCKTEADLDAVGGWDAFICSSVADKAAGPLAKVVGELNDDEMRKFVIWVVGEIGRKKRPLPIDPVPELIALLDNPSLDIRGQTMDSLAKYGSLAQAALPSLRGIMQRDRGTDALRATVAVKEINPSEEIASRLRELYFSDEPGVRINAMDQIAEYFPPEEAKQFLMAQYELTTDRITRHAIAEAMNKIKE